LTDRGRRFTISEAQLQGKCRFFGLIWSLFGRKGPTAVPEYQQAEQIQKFVDELFEISKAFWAAQSRSKSDEGTDISETEFLALDFLTRAEPPVCVGDIQRHIDVLPAQMSRIVRSLEQKGENSLIRCSINQADKRKIDVEMTDAGREAWQAYRRMKLGTMQKMLEGLSESDRADFMRILRQVMTTLRNSRPES
jgi:DNA-binding MarR family transcriptional regulator